MVNRLVKIDRTWCMPDRYSFKMKPVKEILERYVGDGKNWVDPFSGYNSPAEFSNDIDEKAPTMMHMDALEFLKGLNTNAFNGALFDPPYSIEMAKRRYKYDGFFDTAMFTRYMSDCKKEIARIVKLDGYAISLGWNSNGIGKKYGFELVEILLIAHGSYHYDTIVTVEKKIDGQEKLVCMENAR